MKHKNEKHRTYQHNHSLSISHQHTHTQLFEWFAHPWKNSWKASYGLVQSLLLHSVGCLQLLQTMISKPKFHLKEQPEVTYLTLNDF